MNTIVNTNKIDRIFILKTFNTQKYEDLLKGLGFCEGNNR
jgi:hypothetical protein